MRIVVVLGIFFALIAAISFAQEEVAVTTIRVWVAVQGSGQEQQPR